VFFPEFVEKIAVPVPNDRTAVAPAPAVVIELPPPPVAVISFANVLDVPDVIRLYPPVVEIEFAIAVEPTARPVFTKLFTVPADNVLVAFIDERSVELTENEVPEAGWLVEIPVSCKIVSRFAVSTVRVVVKVFWLDMVSGTPAKWTTALSNALAVICV
jgi:hypothetical protein